MLVLNRNHGESIVISSNGIDREIFVKVISIRGGQVKLAIDAPTSCVVDREEIYLRKMQEVNQESALGA